MANNTRVVLEGWKEFREALRKLPEELTQDAAGIALDHADDAAAEIRSAYPSRAKGLARTVKVERRYVGRNGVDIRVRNTAREALVYDVGSQARHTRLGAFRGSMPPGNVFRPRIKKYKRLMLEAVKALMVAKGLLVSGDER